MEVKSPLHIVEALLPALIKYEVQWSQRWSSHFESRVILFSLSGIKLRFPGRPAHSLVTMQTTLNSKVTAIQCLSLAVR